MTTLTAHKALNVQPSDILDLPAKLTLTNLTSTGFTVALNGGVKVKFAGSGINPQQPSGTLTEATIFKDGVKFYTLSDFSLQFSNFPNNLLNIFDGADTVNGSFFADTIYGFGGGDTLLGNAGRDTIFGGDGGDTLRGGAYNDTLRGGAGRDKLFGGVDDDKLSGGTGHDILTGDGGQDRFSFLESIRTGVTFDAWDEIRDFNPFADSIGLEGSAFKALRSTAGTSVGQLKASQFSSGTDDNANGPNDFLVYNKATGALWYDSNGSAADTASTIHMKIAELDYGNGHPQAVSAADFILV